MITGYSEPESPVTDLRGVALLPGEKITRVFSPQAGLVRELPVNGRLLITTNQRILSFSQEQSRQETVLVPVEELKGVVVKSNTRRPTTLLRWILLSAAGTFLYGVIAYWITGRFNGPSIPLIQMDLGPLLLLLAGIWGVFFFGRYYFVREASAVTFQGSSWAFTFSYRGDKAEAEIYQVVNTLFIARRSRNGFVDALGGVTGESTPIPSTSSGQALNLPP
jgi:hypothetical protein